MSTPSPQGLVPFTCVDCEKTEAVTPLQARRKKRCAKCKRRKGDERARALRAERRAAREHLPKPVNLGVKEWNDAKWEERMRAVEEGLDMGMSAEGIASDCNVLLTSLMDNLRRRGATELLDRLRKRRDGRRYRKAS